MEFKDEDLLIFWKSLNKFQVKYIMIGGFAVNLHGFPRMTADIDIWLKDDVKNRQNLGKALEQFGYGELSFEKLDFVPGWSDFYIGAGVRLDIITNMKGLEYISFDEALAQANVAQIEGVKVPFINIDHLIKNKKAISRPKDKVDVIELEKIFTANNQNKTS